MNTNSKQINEKLHVCSYCATELNNGAILCPVCGKYQKPWKWRNRIKLRDLSLLAAFGAILIGYLQFKEARQDRLEASEALSRANSVEQTVTELEKEIAQTLSRSSVIEKNVLGLETNIAEARKQIMELDVFRSAVESGAGEISEILAYSRELQTQLDSIRSQVEEIDKQVSTQQLPITPGLIYESSEFHRKGNELIGRITLKPVGNITLSQLKFRIQVVEPSNVRILEVNPGATVTMMVVTSVSQSGKMAELQYTKIDASNPAISLRLSGSTVLKIEGSPGLEPFTVRVE